MKDSNVNDESRALLYGSNEVDCCIPDIEEVPISMFYAEHVEPYIYTIKSAERLLRLDGNPNDFISILDRMTYDDNDDKIPSILCRDILGKLVFPEDDNENIVSEDPLDPDDASMTLDASMDQNNHDNQPTNSNDDSYDEPTKEEKIDDEASDKGRHTYRGLIASSVRLKPKMMLTNDNNDNVQFNEFNLNPTKTNEDTTHKQLNTTATNDKRQINDRSAVTKNRRRKKQFRMECLALITYSLNLNPSIRKQISMEMSSLTTDRELHIKSIRSADNKTVSSVRASVDQSPVKMSASPTVIDEEAVIKMINQSVMKIVNQSFMNMFNPSIFQGFDHSIEEEKSVMAHEITSTKQRMEGMTTFTNILSSRKVQLKRDVVMQGRTYNILKKNH